MRYVDMNGHEWWDPIANLTTAASDVVGAATDVANAASNAWNSLPPAISDTVATVGGGLAGQATDAAGEVAKAVSNPEVQATLAAAAITVTACVAIVATGGAATPWALGAALGADSSLVVGLAQGRATLGTVLTSAGIGGVSGGLGAGAGVLTTAAIGAVGTFADQQATSVVTTGHFAAITPQSMFGVAAGAVIGAYSGQIASSIVGSSSDFSTDLQSGIISASISTLTTFTLSTYTPTPMILREL